MNNLVQRQRLRRFSAVGGFLLGMSAIGAILSPFAFAQDTDFSQYEVIEERNIFRPIDNVSATSDTNQASPGIATTSSAASSVGEFILTGIIKIKGQFLAILEKKSGEKGFTVKVNDKIEDYTVKDIQKDTVTLEKDGRMSIITLNISSKEIQVSDQNSTAASEEGITEEEADGKNVVDTNIMRKLRMGGIP